MSCSISTMVRRRFRAPQGLDHALGFVMAGSGERLVEKEQFRRGRKRDGEFELALLAVRQQARGNVGARGEPDLRRGNPSPARSAPFSCDALPKKRKLDPERA